MGGKKLYSIHKRAIRKLAHGLGRDKFFKLLKRYNLLVKKQKKYARTTQSSHRFKIYKNLCKGWRPTGSNQLWVGDITYIRVRTGFVYLSLLTDGYSRKIIGWNLSKSLGIEGAMETARMAVNQNKASNNTIHHSDRGIQYCSPTYVEYLGDKGVKMSMGEKGNCYDNAMAERVNGILKQEYSLDTTFNSTEDTLKAVKEGIKHYNEQRPHWALKLKTPAIVHAEN
jgi:transposase InsO family protein